MEKVLLKLEGPDKGLADSQLSPCLLETTARIRVAKRQCLIGIFDQHLWICQGLGLWTWIIQGLNKLLRFGSYFSLLCLNKDSTGTSVKLNNYCNEWKVDMNAYRSMHMICSFYVTPPQKHSHCCQACTLSHSHRFPMLHLPMRKPLQNSHHHPTHPKIQQGTWEMLKWFP